MSEPARGGDAVARRPRPALWILGLLSVTTFWIPIWAPLVPIVALVATALHAARRGSDRSSLFVGGAGGLAGLALYLLLEYLWVV